MAITNDFRKTVQEGNIMRVRIIMKDSLLVDPTGRQYDEMEQYAVDNMGNIYVEHDGEDLKLEVTAWNKDYLNVQMVAVVNNFSEERIKLLKKMVRYLYKDKIEKNNEENQPSEPIISRKQVGAGVTVVGAAVSVVGMCTAHTALAIGGAIIAVAGVALVISDK